MAAPWVWVRPCLVQLDFVPQFKAPVSIVVGDGGLSLQNEKGDGRQFDIITIDAFTGDGIPTHLLTRKAMEVYLSRLAPDGLLLFHISNRYYDLRPLMKAMGEQLKLHGVMNRPSQQATLTIYNRSAICVAFSRNTEKLQPLIQRGWIPLGANDGVGPAAPWTDDYINILSPLIARFKVWKNGRMLRGEPFLIQPV